MRSTKVACKRPQPIRSRIREREIKPNHRMKVFEVSGEIKRSRQGFIERKNRQPDGNQDDSHLQRPTLCWGMKSMTQSSHLEII
jgi:hypothetical protein